ncbi:hypothetical protein NKH60_34335 [Mesorhizobium sp. M1006]|uniref:hypothetical protein n=1 Tax=Mesorhizobium sp. M1006 TaxID=2957048 RepID=UPI00333526AF
MKYGWRPTLAPVQTRYDDIWFVSPSIGWAVKALVRSFTQKMAGKLLGRSSTPLIRTRGCGV